MAERWLAAIHGRLRQLPAVAKAGGVPIRRDKAFPRSRAETAVGDESRARRLALYEEVRRRHAAGEALLAISRRMRLARGTVRQGGDLSRACGAAAKAKPAGSLPCLAGNPTGGARWECPGIVA
jgi:hypothetical protein